MFHSNRISCRLTKISICHNNLSLMFLCTYTKLSMQIVLDCSDWVQYSVAQTSASLCRNKGETLIGSISFTFKLKMFISLLDLDHHPIVILKLWMPLYLCIWYFCWFLQSCFTMSRTCDHFTASEKHVWTGVSVADQAFVNTTLQCQHIQHQIIPGLSYHIDTLKCELHQSNSRQSLLRPGTAVASFVSVVDSVAKVLLRFISRCWTLRRRCRSGWRVYVCLYTVYMCVWEGLCGPELISN